MDYAEPGLFELPDPEPQAPRRRPRRGRNRETWKRTAAAEVTILDAAAVEEAAMRAEASAVTIATIATSAVDAPHDAGAGPVAGPLDRLAQLIWPTDGLESLVEAGAFRVVSVECDVVGESADRGTATWTVTVKLTDVDRLRRLAVQAQPDEAPLVTDSLAVAWEVAADPFAPLRSIPGIAWRPVTVDVDHLPA